MTVRQFFRNNFYPPAKANLLDLLDSTGAQAGVVLWESGTVSGIVTLYSWTRFPTTAHLTLRESDYRKRNEARLIERQLSVPDFDALMAQLKQAENIGNYSGKVKDGVLYSLCWGGRSELTTLHIGNPQMGSKRHEDLIRMVKSFAQPRT